MDDGWFILNLAEIGWETVPGGGTWCGFEILMVGTRTPGHRVEYVAEPAAAAHGVSVPKTTDSPREAYATRPPIVPARSPWPLD